MQQTFEGNQRDKPPSIALWGIGGIGKTELALKYAYRNRNEYSTIVLFNARSEGVLKTDVEEFFDFLNKRKDERLLKMAREDGSDKCRVVTRWFEEEKKWLMIFDNVDLQPHFALNKYFPRHSPGHRILISRSREILDFAGQEIEVREMSTEDSCRVLLKRAAWANPTEAEQETAHLIVDELSRIPFFIEIAAKYIRDNQSSLEHYLTLLRSQKQNMMLASPKGLMGDSFASWVLAYDRLIPHESTMVLLKLFAFLEGSDISPTL